jgi:hypothetical protein
MQKQYRNAFTEARKRVDEAYAMTGNTHPFGSTISERRSARQLDLACRPKRWRPVRNAESGYGAESGSKSVVIGVAVIGLIVTLGAPR